MNKLCYISVFLIIKMFRYVLTPKAINKSCYISVFIISLIVLSSPQISFSQGERLAVVSSFEGQIKIERGGVWKTVTKIGNRMRNSSVHSGDTVLTMPGAKAIMVFNDGSRLEVREDTTMTISEEQITDNAAQQGYVVKVAGALEKEVVRNIKLRAGGLWANITPSKSVLTEFEMPTGIATVRGTIVTFNEQPDGSFAIETVEGLMGYVTPGKDPVAFDLGSGDVVTIGVPIAGEVSLSVKSGAIEAQSGGIELSLDGGDAVSVEGMTVEVTDTTNGVTLEAGDSTLTMGDGSSIAMAQDADTGDIIVDYVNGTVTMPDGTDVQPGFNLGPPPAIYGAPPPIADLGDDPDPDEPDEPDGPDEPEDGPTGPLNPTPPDEVDTKEDTKEDPPQTMSGSEAMDLLSHYGSGGAFVPHPVNGRNKIDNGTFAAGISRDGSLIEPNRTNRQGGFGMVLNGFNNRGLENGDVLAIGDPNEGYGVSYDAGGNEFLARIGSGDGADSSSYDTTIYTKGSRHSRETFTHKVGVDRLDSKIKGDLDITHRFELVPPELHQGAQGFDPEKMLSVSVKMTNTGANDITNLKYRRVADFDNGSFAGGGSKFTVPDIGGVTFGDATLEFAGAPEFFPEYDPMADGSLPPGVYTGDRTALLQFALGTLAPGESKTFTFFYTGQDSVAELSDIKDNELSGIKDNIIENATYVSSTRDGGQPYPTFALGTGSSNSLIKDDLTSIESQHFNILTDTLSLMLRTIAFEIPATYHTSTVSSDGKLDFPEGLAIDSSGDLIVTVLADETVESGNPGSILRVNPSDGSITTIADNSNSGGKIEAPHRVAIVSDSKKGLVSGDLVVVDFADDNVLKINPTDGTTSIIASKSSTGGMINEPEGIAIDSDGNLIVLITGEEGVDDGAILKVDPSDGSTTTIADNSSSSGKIGEPHDIAIDSAGNYIIADMSGAILKVDSSDGNTTTIVSESSTGGVIKEPWGVAIDSYGLLVVTDAVADKVFKIDPVSGDLRVIVTNTPEDKDKKLDEPSGVAIASDDSVYIANANKDSIVKIEESTSTNFLLAFAKKIRGDMDTHDDEHTDAGDATVHAEHQTFMDTMDDVIDDIDLNISSPNTVDNMDIFNAVKDARDLFMDGHAGMKETVQHASLVHILLDSKRMADDQVRLNLASIHKSINQVKNFMEEHINDFGDATVHGDIRSQLDSILAKIGTVRDNIYDVAAANAIRNEIQEAFCDVVDYTIHGDEGHSHEGHHEGNPFPSCHHDEVEQS